MNKRMLCLAALLTGWVSFAAASFVPSTTADLVTHATLVITGTVDAVTSYPPDGNGVIYSEAKIRVRDSVVGATPQEYVIVRYMGGKYGNLIFGVTAEPVFAVGEDVVLFLAAADGGAYRCPDGAQGKLTVVEETVFPVGKALTDYLKSIAAATGR